MRRNKVTDPGASDYSDHSDTEAGGFSVIHPNANRRMTRVIEEGIYNLNPDGSARDGSAADGEKHEKDSFHTDTEQESVEDPEEYKTRSAAGIKVENVDKSPKTPNENLWFWQR